MHMFDDFMPEELETQHLDLTSLLSHIYQPAGGEEKTISPDEQEHILAEVRASLLNTHEHILREVRASLLAADTSSMENTRPLPTHTVAPEKNRLAAPGTLPAPVTRKRRLSRTARLFNALAAVLAVAILTAAAIVLFAAHPASHIGAVPQSGPQSTTTPPCLPASSMVGIGLDYLCTQHLFQSAHIVQSNKDYRFTLTEGYADQGQVLVWYQIEQKVNGRFQQLNPSTIMLGGSASGSLAPDGHLINMSGDIDKPGLLGWSYEPSLPVFNSNGTLEPSKVSSGAGTAQAVTLQMHFSGFSIFTSKLENINLPISFKVTLPVHGSWHSVSLQQTRTAQQHTLTLTSMSYSLSMVNILFHSPEPSFSHTYNAPTRPYSVPIVTSLRVCNVECILNPQDHFYQGAPASQPYGGMQYQGPDGIFWQNINCSFAGMNIAPHSEVTLVISMYSTAALRNTTLPATATWTFRFPLP